MIQFIESIIQWFSENPWIGILSIIGTLGAPIILISFCVFRPKTNSVYAIMAGKNFRKFIGFPHSKTTKNSVGRSKVTKRRVNPRTGNYMSRKDYIKQFGISPFYGFWKYIGFMWVGIPGFRKIYTHVETYKETRIKPHTSNEGSLIEYETVDVNIESQELPRQETITVTFFGKTADNAFIEVYLTVISNVTDMWKWYFRKKDQRSEARDTVYTLIKEFCVEKHKVEGHTDFEHGYEYLYAQKTEGLSVSNCRKCVKADVKPGGIHQNKGLYYNIVSNEETEDDFGLDIVNVNFPYIGPMMDLLEALQKETIAAAEGKASLVEAEWNKKTTIATSEGLAQSTINTETASNVMERALLRIKATGHKQFIEAMKKQGVDPNRAAIAWSIANHEGGLAIDSKAMLTI